MKEKNMRQLGNKIEPTGDFYNRLEGNILSKLELNDRKKKSLKLYKKTTILATIVILVISTITATLVIAMNNEPNVLAILTPEESKHISDISNDFTGDMSASISANSEESIPSDESLPSVSDDNLTEPTGDYTSCIHYQDYHAISGQLIQYVGESEFYEWVEEAGKINVTEECCYGNANIYDFIKYFDFPKEEFENIYYGSSLYYYTYYDIELLYSDNKEQIEETYKNYDLIRKIKKARDGEASIKRRLVINFDKTNAYSKMESSAWTIAEFVYQNDVSREDLQDVINYVADAFYKKGYSIYSYDLEKIYSKSQVILDAIADESIYSIQVDEMLRIK